MSQSRRYHYVGRYKVALSDDGERWEVIDRVTNQVEHTETKKFDAVTWAAEHSRTKRVGNA